ncbi:kinectin isoform X1 [Cygnus olor]|uniref:kinectin isoform X1 n=1 Tax=Cygnus olor TaxID=8869 RepID=UPI001ADE3968|nr:kinectin isoform X1 [Cygnus olor]XP_040413762.1 kinectin isoform X1 [Cygnus olor]XP_040413763.1 kinectin isoform X1 [Cygnus olor]XP_040413764.1 kinectin isoform X1 [Cygnus olor]XP_040413766.1 kinectin isoform X1 [Cygnus olor]XP_040413767.1 kinectin isoform X1 [Cygnus olor]XP_040413768.1 kinectin isoform X1 [Cygnus olor]
MEFYESTYFIILIPSVVITVIFLFFWLFMKETLYDEVLAKQKRDLKFPPAKSDKKKTEKKKNKKKEAQNGNIHESDSESTPRDFKLSDALGTDEEHVVPVPLSMTEAASGVRERKKKEKKQKATQDDHVTKESEGSKSSGKKVEPVPVTKQPTPPSESAASKKKPGQKKQKNGMDDQDTKTDSVASPAKKQDPVLLHQEIKQENVSGKKKVSAKKQKVDNVLVDEPLIQATTYIPLMDNSDAGTVEKREVVEAVKQNMNEGIQKSSGKKMKNETDKENAEVKFKDFVMAMKNMIFTEDEARCVVEVLKEKSGAIHDALQKASKAESAAAIHQLQDKEKMLAVVKEEAAVAKEQCKQLTQELVAEKERNSLLTAKMRERINTLEKEHGTFQSKIHVSFQESQQMKMKFQQLREQMEAEISHLKQENGILRDAVSTSTNQMESKQSAELNKLRQDYARLVNELGEKSSKLQQEELQKKNAEQAVAQLKVQQQEAERRWEEIQAYLRKRTAEHEAAQQDVQNKLVAKDNEIQSLHSKLTDTMVSKQQLEQRMLQLMENEQKRATKEDSMQMRVQELIEQNDALNAQLQKLHSQMAAQTSASVLAEELHKVIAEKDKQLKQMEDSLGNEHANLTSKEEELKVLQNMNLSLKSEVQKLQALTNEQAAAAHELERMQKSIHIKDDKIRTLEEQLREELAQTANTKEEFKVLKDQNKTLQAEVQKLQTLLSEPVQPVYAEANKDLLEQMERSMREKDDKIKTVEELLEAGLIQVANKEEDLKALRTENSSLRKELQSLQIQLSEQVSFQSLVEELQKVIHEKDGKIKSVEELLQAEILKVASKEKTVQALTQKIEALKEEVGNSQLEMEKQVSITSQVKELQTLLKGKENQVKTMEALLEEKEKEIVKKGEWLKGQQDTIAQLTSKVQELEQQNLQQLQQVPAASHVQDLESLLKEEKEQMQKLKAVLEEKEREIASQVKQLQDMQKENESFKVQIQELKQENCKQASLAVQSEELLQVVAGKEKEITSLQNELACQRNAFEQQRKKNNDLREKNWKAMEALASTEKLLQDKVNKTAKERQQHLEAAEVETRELLQKLFPNVSLPSNVSHSEWICGFEKMAKEYLRGASGSEDVKAMEQKLKEAEEMHILLQLECEKYKSVLAETEGILQRLQRSVEEEESKWKIKVEESQKELKQMRSSVVSLEHEVERLREEIKEVETLKKEREHLESELEKAEIERSTYVSEVRELKDLLTELQKKLDDSYSEAVRQNEELNLLKTQLSETLSKLKVDQNERQKVAGDLPKAQESLASLEREIGKVFGDANVIENSDVRTDSELTDKRLNVAVNLNQDVGHLKKLLVSVSQMLSKGREHYQLVE